MYTPYFNVVVSLVIELLNDKIKKFDLFWQIGSNISWIFKIGELVKSIVVTRYNGFQLASPGGLNKDTTVARYS